MIRRLSLKGHLQSFNQYLFSPNRDSLKGFTSTLLITVRYKHETRIATIRILVNYRFSIAGYNY